MATTAQIEANRRNSKRSTGPTSAKGNATVRMNSYKHGMTARTIMPVLPQEDARELEERIQQTIAAMQPLTPMEQDLVEARCGSPPISTAPSGSARRDLAHRVRKATILDPKEASSLEVRTVHELGTKLFYQTAIGPGYPDATPDDYPAVIVRRLEEVENSTDDKIGIVSHEDMDATDGTGDGQAPKKAQNKANLKSKKDLEPQGLESETAESEARKRSGPCGS